VTEIVNENELFAVKTHRFGCGNREVPEKLTCFGQQKIHNFFQVFSFAGLRTEIRKTENAFGNPADHRI
jgi:hypothetical protein